MKASKVLFICTALICALTLCSGQSFASEKDEKGDVKQVDESVPKKTTMPDKKEETNLKRPENEPQKKQERTLFEDDWINLL